MRHNPVRLSSEKSQRYIILERPANICFFFILGGFPHVFGNNRKLQFSDKCKGKKLYEFPLLHGDSIFGGGNPGADRVVFYIYTDNPDTKPTENGAYCGVMTHDGAPKGEFALCKVED